MKKFLLLGAMAALMAGAAHADTFGDYFQLTDKAGNVIAPGTTINVGISFIDEDEDYKAISYGEDVYLSGVTPEPVAAYIEMGYDKPDGATFKSDTMMWGFPAICYSQTYDKAGTCNANYTAEVGPNVTINIPPADTFSVELKLDLNNPDWDATVDMVLTIAALDGDANTGTEEIEGAIASWPLHFSREQGSVGGVGVDAATPEYYTLTGVRVANPEKGIYLVKRGAKVTKQVL